MAKGSGSQLPETEIRRLLSSLQIEHSEVKPGKHLDLLLKRAIKKVESLSEAVAGGGQKKLDPASLPSSPRDQVAVRAFNTSYTFNEIIQELREQAGDCSFKGEENVFFEYRATLGHLARNFCQSDSDFAICQDEAQTSGLVIKILGLRMLPNGQHLMEVKYLHNTRNAVRAEHLQAIQAERQDPAMAMKVSVAEGLFLKKVLEINSAKLDNGYKASLAKDNGMHGGLFQPSFLLPADPLSGDQAEDVSRMQCAHCKKAPAHSTCSRCKLVKYCGKDCQSAHWPGHKQACKAEAARQAAAKVASVETAAFADAEPAANDGGDPAAAVDIPLGQASGISGFTSAIPMNRPVRKMDMPSLPTSQIDQTPPNVHGSSKFIVKVQSAAGNILGMESPHMIYDKDRSFQAFMDPRVGAGYHRTSAVISNHGIQGRKIYLWAHRIAADRLRIYLDNRPSQSQNW